MKYERQFIESVEAERIPEDPRISDLERLKLWAGADYDVSHDEDGVLVIVWMVNSWPVPTEPGNWIAKDHENCLMFYEDADFRSLYREIEPHLSEVLAPFAEYERDGPSEWVMRPPVVSYG